MLLAALETLLVLLVVLDTPWEELLLDDWLVELARADPLVPTADAAGIHFSWI